MKVIILKITPYKEKDAIITSLSEEGLVEFHAYGVLSPKSKNHWLNNVLNVANVEFQQSGSSQKNLKESELIFTPLKNDMSLEYLGLISLINEATNNLLMEDEMIQIFNPLIDLLLKVKSGIDPYLTAIKYLFDILKIGGYDFEYNKCVKCGGKKGITSFSFYEGGFICNKCAHEINNNDLSIKQMLLLRNVMIRTDYNFEGISFIKSDAQEILIKLNSFIYDSLGIEIKGIQLL